MLHKCNNLILNNLLCVFRWLYYTVIDWVRGQKKLHAVVREACLLLFCYIHIHFFQNFLIHSFHLHIHKMFSISSYVKSEILDDALPWHCDVNIMWLIEPMKIRPSVKCQIAGNRWMNCWPVNRTVLQHRDFVVNRKNIV